MRHDVYLNPFCQWIWWKWKQKTYWVKPEIQVVRSRTYQTIPKLRRSKYLIIPAFLSYFKDFHFDGQEATRNKHLHTNFTCRQAHSNNVWVRLQLHGAIYCPDSFVLVLRYTANLKAIRHESTSLYRIVAYKSYRVIVPFWKQVTVGNRKFYQVQTNTLQLRFLYKTFGFES